MIRKLIARFLLGLAEQFDPALITARREYEKEKFALLSEIALQQQQVSALTAEADLLIIERNDALNAIAEIKAKVGLLNPTIGADHSADRSDTDVLRADLFSSGTGKTP